MKSHVVSYARASILMPLLFLLSITGKGQNQPVYNVPGPEIANLGLYGQVPVSYYTGVPDISVPLHEIKVGKFSMPITASYHVRSVKPNQTPGPLGLGWNLIAGGYITRTVRNIYDEKMDNQMNECGFYAHHSKMKNINVHQFDVYNDNSGFGTNYVFELAPDEFSFSFCGYQGNFYMNEDGGWTVISDQDIKVEFDPSTGFASLNQLVSANRLHPNQWAGESFNQRYYIKFTLITPDGVRYEFGGINATEFCISYYGRNNSDLIACSWRLTKITTPDNHVITLDYDTTAQTCDIEYKPLKRVKYNVQEFTENPIQRIGKSGFTGFLYFPVNINSITTPNETIEFTYNRDKNYCLQLLKREISSSGYHYVLYWPDIFQYYRGNIYNLRDEENSSNSDFFLFTNAQEGVDQKETIESVANSMVNYLLHRIAIRNRNNGSTKSVYFDYDMIGRKKLSLILLRGDIPDLVTRWELDGHGVYVETPYLLPTDEGLTVTPPKQEYHFAYNHKKRLYWGYIQSKTDTWGFWHGDSIVISDGLDFTVVRPNLEATMAEVLTEITYPTGGRCLFDYELNSYSKLVDSLHTGLHNRSGYAGGLRIKSVTNKDRNNRFVSRKRYYYTANRNDTIITKSSGICKGFPVYHTFISQGEGEEQVSIDQWATGGVYAPVTCMNSPDVGYTWVIEEYQDSIGNILGDIRYRYSNYDADINNNTHLDEACLYTKVPGNSNVAGLSPYTSTSFERGRLLSKEYRDKNGIIYKKEVYNYSRTNHPPLVTAYQDMVVFGYNDDFALITGCIGWLTYTHTASYLPVSVTETIRSTNGQTVEYRTKTFEYNTHKMLSRETCTMSDGTEEVTTYKYPFDYTSYRWMTDANITAPVIEKKVTAGGLTHTETNEYAGNSNGVPYIQKRTVGTGGSGRTEFEVSRVDSYGNPVEMTVNGISNVLCWGYEGQRLLAHVENATFNKLKYLLNLSPYATTVGYSALVNGRSLLPSALFHLYQYDANLRLQSETTPNGITTFYKYDNFGRLCEIYYIDGVTGNKKLLESYGYHYYNQQQ